MRESVVVTLDRYKVGRGGSFIIHQVHLNEVVELLNSNSTDTFKVNGHRFKPFIESFKQENEEINQSPYFLFNFVNLKDLLILLILILVLSCVIYM